MLTLGRKEAKQINTDTLKSTKSCQQLSSVTSNKNLFIQAKNQKNYMDYMKTNIINKGLEQTPFGIQFFNYFKTVQKIYSQIEKDWFWISNGDNFSQFTRNHQNNNTSQFINNCNLLEKITKSYGFA